ncbi:MAG: hypothetical protein DPW18_03030 [Chloroflexi bacterium]|nr:hypothetical protein [Chloroflexota bacterium]MDL1943051.1 glycosyltransferase family 4 protein [Chloroflexi bacterium CFX2]
MNNNHSQIAKTPARHCMVVHAYYPLGETRVEREALALVKHGIEVDVICLKKPSDPESERINGVQVHRLPVQRQRGQGLFAQLFEYLAFFIRAFLRLTRLHFKNRYHIVQVHNLPDFLVFVALIPKLMGAKVILDIHDLMPEFYAERYQRPMNNFLVRLIRLQEWLSCRFASHIITVTELWRQALIQRGQPAEKISVVMNVADDNIFRRGAGARTAKQNRFLMIYHGVIGQRHGLDLVLRAMHKIKGEAPDVRFLLHGWGEYSNDLLNLAEELGISNLVQFSTTGLSTSELPTLLTSADLAVVPYRNGVFTGGILPTKLMEYAALGVPAIAARTPAIAAYFDDETVQFFAPDNVDDLAGCILSLYRDRARLSALARNIVKFNEKYNWQRVSEDYVNLVNRLGTNGRR